MNELQIFTNSEFGSLEIVNGKLYFPATKCAEILRYSDPYDAIIQRGHTESLRTVKIIL